MSFNVALAPRLPGNIPRIAYPVKHGTDWISPFTATPTDETGYKKIRIRDENGVLQQRLFKIIDTATYQDPISFEGYPTDPLDPAQGIAILSCCNNAFKINSIQACFFAIHPKTCPMCRATNFPTPSTILGGKAAPTAATPLGRQHVFNPHLTKAVGNVLVFSSIFFLRIGAELLGSATASTTSLLISSGLGSVLLGTGITLINLSNINPNLRLIDKIRQVGIGVLIGSVFNGIGTFTIVAFKYTIITSALAGTGALVTTLSIAIFYSKFLC